MSMITERYSPLPLAVNTVTLLPQGSPTGICGFLCVTSGTLSVTRLDGVVVVNTIPVTAGTYLAMPFYIGANATITLAGGASGTLGTQ